MPIRAEMRARYPKDWDARSRFVRFYRAKNRCEWCGAENHKPHPETGSQVVLTAAHVFDHRPEAASLLNLAALCQRCHLRHDAPIHADNRRKARAKKSGQLEMFAPTCREFVALRVFQQQKTQHEIAKAMGYSAPDLSRKLAQNPDDSRRFTLDDLEKYMTVTGDTQPVVYLVEKYLGCPENEIAALEKRLAELKSQSEPPDSGPLKQHQRRGKS